MKHNNYLPKNRHVNCQKKYECKPGPYENFSRPLEKCVGRGSKLLDVVQKIWVPLRKLFAPPGVPSWLRA